MRQVFLDKGSTVVKKVCQPYLDDYSVLVAVHYSWISSGTEMATISNAESNVLLSNIPHKIKKVLESVSSHGIEGTAALIKGKLKGEVQALGYSCSGRVIAIGKKVNTVHTGDFVACAGAGFAHHADIVCVPENLVTKVVEEKNLKAASLTTIGSIALQGLRRAQVQLGEHVCVLGLGLLGQITVQLAKRAGCIVTGIDLLPERLQLAQELGADFVFNAQHDDIQKEVAFSTDHLGVDTTIITAASKSDAIVQQAMQVTRKKGKVVLVGDVGLSLERDPFYKKEIDFLISCSYGPGRYDQEYEQEGKDYPHAYVRWTENRNMQAFVHLIEQNEIKIDPLVSAEISVEKAQEAYAELKEKKGLGVILTYPTVDEQKMLAEKKEQQVTQEKEVSFFPAVKDELRVGVVGVGGFAKIKLMPIISKINNVKINAVVDTNITTSLNASRQYEAARALVDDSELFETNDLVDVVVIASPHKFHCDQALKAMQNGKAVFMEKPMVTNFEQFARFRDFLTQNPNMPFCVDYNRSFAPFVQKIKKELVKRRTPMMVHYRMNAGFIPKEHWVQTDVGAGRIIGEACHIFDLFCYLTDTKPVSISVEALSSSSKNLFPTDNFSVQIRFDDGSVCTLLYTALGHKSLGKERMEVYYDSKAIVMDDYLKLMGFGLPKSFNETATTPDKGHSTLINQFFGGIKAADFKPPISVDRLNTVAELTLAIDQLACEGGGEKELE